MRCDQHRQNPESLFEHYVRDLLLVAHCGGQEARREFLRRYTGQLGGLAEYLELQSEDDQAKAFADATVMCSGGWPRSLPGHRLAAPRWFVRRVPDTLSTWEASASYRPRRLAVDPVCGMLVDPDETPFVSRHGGEDAYFCCGGCLASFEGRHDALAVPLTA
jgi:YHS domain-containing protein